MKTYLTYLKLALGAPCIADLVDTEEHDKYKSAYSSFLFFFLFSFIFISWRLITLQYCSGFCHTLTWISHGVTCIPHPDPPSHLALHPIPLGLPVHKARALVSCIQPGLVICFTLDNIHVSMLLYVVKSWREFYEIIHSKAFWVPVQWRQQDDGTKDLTWCSSRPSGKRRSH